VVCEGKEITKTGSIIALKPSVDLNWRPVPGHCLTRWAKDLTPQNAWQEYPRPQMTRKEWLNLNGLWNYAITSKPQHLVPDFYGQILVPFPLESALSGVKRPLHKGEQLWYRRSFSIPITWRGRRILLHFGAVDWEAKILINNVKVGEHTGGFLPFSIDITNLVSYESLNELIVAVVDPTDTHWQARGKQARVPKTIWYTSVSGIWQTVWLEPVPATYITSLKITPDVDAASVRVKVNLVGSQPDLKGASVRVMNKGALVAQEYLDSMTNEVSVPIPDLELWSPASPHLYDLEVSAGEDIVSSYFGMRKFSVEAGRLCLNGFPQFFYGPLDQGYWPDGLYTPPSDEAMRHDIELVKGLGCNLLRKHVKVEPARYYYYCDKLGLVVWQDMPNGGAVVNELSLALINLVGIDFNDRNYHRTGRAEAASRQDFHRELSEMVDHLYNFACIGMWVPFNEAWGQFDANEVADWLSMYDTTRPVDHASGWFDQKGGDCKSLHIYFRKLKARMSKDRRATVLSEFGAYSLKVEGHLWDPAVDFGYKKFTKSDDLTKAYINLLENELQPWVDAGLSAAVYTQTTDVENEVNGYVTYDREVEKMDFEKVRMAHRNLIRLGE
jgi:beta-galactosidase/beta-glucuronidase